VRVAVVAVAIAAIDRAAAAEPSEPEVKAEFVERFIRFVDWDAKSLGDQFVACVVGDSPITPFLQRIAKTRKLKDRPASVKLIGADKADHLDGCHIALLGALDRAQLTSVLHRAAGHPILTIADAPGAAAAGAIINFYREDDHIRYETNVRAAEDAGLHLRARLRELARDVNQHARDE
jgi:hypothetical protein